MTFKQAEKVKSESGPASTNYSDAGAAIMKIVSYQFPIAVDELPQIADMLRYRDVLTPGFDARHADVYDPVTYLVQKEDHGRTLACWPIGIYSRDGLT